MNAKQFLYSVRDELSEIRSLERRIEQAEAEAEGLRGIRYDKPRVQSSAGNTMPDRVANIVKYKDQLQQKRDALYLKRQKAQALIDRLDDSIQRQILELYFLDDDRLTMEKVAEQINYSRSSTYDKYQSALRELNIIMRKDRTESDSKVC